jgi:hypothetical protein
MSVRLTSLVEEVPIEDYVLPLSKAEVLIPGIIQTPFVY